MVLPTGTFSENLPSISVIVPVVVPFTETLAPIIVSPVASLTIPETVREFCCVTVTPVFNSDPFSAKTEVDESNARNARPNGQFPNLKAYSLSSLCLILNS